MLKQIVKSVLYLLVVVLAISAAGSSALAQGSSPVSPWMHMFDRPANPTLGNYLGNVRPQQNLIRAQTTQADQIRAQQQALQALQSQGTGGSGTGGVGARSLVGAGTAPSGGAASTRDVLAPPRELPRVQRGAAGFNQYMSSYPSRSMTRKPVPNFSATGRRR